MNILSFKTKNENFIVKNDISIVNACNLSSPSFLQRGSFKLRVNIQNLHFYLIFTILALSFILKHFTEQQNLNIFIFLYERFVEASSRSCLFVVDETFVFSSTLYEYNNYTSQGKTIVDIQCLTLYLFVKFFFQF